MKKFIPLILVAFFPYTIVLMSTQLFGGPLNIYLVLLWVLIFWFVALICAIAVFAISLKRKWDPYELALVNMIIKLLQIPAYICIFAVGFVCFFTIFTILISIVLILLDGMSILLSGLIGLAAVKRNHTANVLSTQSLFVHGILQFVFCADVVSAIIVFKKARLARSK